MTTYETKVICDRCKKDITKMTQRPLSRRQIFWFRDTITNYDLCSECDSSFRFHWLEGKPVDGVKEDEV